MALSSRSSLLISDSIARASWTKPSADLLNSGIVSSTLCVFKVLSCGWVAHQFLPKRAIVPPMRKLPAQRPCSERASVSMPEAIRRA